MAVLFAQEGANVAILDIDDAGGRETEAAIGGQSVFLRTDVSDASSVDGAIRAVLGRFGRIDVLCNHAGTIIVKPFLDTIEAEWDRLMAINVKGMFLMTKAVLPSMLAAGGGVIVAILAAAAVVAGIVIVADEDDNADSN